MGKFSKINIVFLVLAVVWMGIIFYMSSKTAEESEASSNTVELAFGQLTQENFSEQTEEEVENFLMDYRIPIRKAAHAAEYALLCVLVFLSIPDSLKKRWQFLLATGITIFYGISDEIHQYFVPGRTALVSDVLIDSAGALAGGIGIWILVVLYQRVKGQIGIEKQE